jgi:phosphohistidine phosphatase
VTFMSFALEFGSDWTMKTLIVLRHAQAEHPSDSQDHERPLTEKGVREARRIGRLLRGLRPELVLCSTALRARATNEEALSSAQLSPRVQELDQLYDSDVPQHLDAMCRVDGATSHLMIVGHNPTLERLVSQLVCRPIVMRTGTVAVVAIPVQTWQDVDPSLPGALVGLFDPVMLKKKARSNDSP